MRAEDVQEHLRKRPFVPFRIHLSDGSAYEIRHPEMAWVRPAVIYIGAEARAGGATRDRGVDHASLFHIVSVEELSDSSAPRG